MLHGQHVFGKYLAGLCAHDGDAQDTVFARRREYLNESSGLAIRDGAIEVINGKLSDLVSNSGCLRRLLIQADTGHLGVNKGCPWYDPVVDRKPLKVTE